MREKYNGKKKKKHLQFWKYFHRHAYQKLGINQYWYLINKDEFVHQISVADKWMFDILVYPFMVKGSKKQEILKELIAKYFTENYDVSVFVELFTSINLKFELTERFINWRKVISFKWLKLYNVYWQRLKIRCK